ncbi:MULTISPECIES: VOC family protein [unclassified Devosia]|uniref:VOC family protein n=1 Tax=unclassified Devosia TaxID=196773 RepID=UPI001555782E|nr:MULTISPECIES: VOC family protein [unclassified Devosia]
MLQGFEHIGMTSGDLDRTIWFYCDLLGLRLHLRKPASSGEVAFLDAGGGMLEIFAPAEPVSRAQDVPPQTAGMRHMTFAFSDIDPVVQRLEEEGLEIIERPRLAHNQDVFKRVAFCRDPDGIIVELAERAASRP